MANKKTYWLGEKVGSRRVGQLKVAGRLYGIGKSFPADKMDKDILSGLRKSGCVGDAPFHVPDPKIDNAKDKDIALLQGKLSEAATENSELKIDAIKNGDKIAGLELETEELRKNVDGDSVKEIAELKKQVIELESEVERLSGEAKEADDKKAAHIQDHIDNPTPDVAALETDNEEKAALIEKQKAEIKALKKTIKDGKK